MKPSLWRARVRHSRRLAVGLSLVVGMLAAAVLLLGWGLDLAMLRRIIPGQPGMAPTTAGGLLLAALGIAIESRTPLRRRPRAVPLLAPPLLAIAALDLVLLALEPGHALDNVLFGAAVRDIYMSPATAACLAMVATCLALPQRRAGSLLGDLFGLVTATGLAVTVLALTGYFFDSESLRDVFVFAAMAPQTAFSYFLCFLALAASRPTSGWVAIMVGPGPGGATLRRTLPYVALGPFVFCWTTLLAVDGGVFDANFRLSVLAIAGAGGLVALLFWSAMRENTDWRSILASNRLLRHALAERDVLLREVYHRVKNNLQFVDAMLALESGVGHSAEENERLSRIRRRLHALSLVHQQLMGAKDLAVLDLRDFLTELCGNLARGSGLDQHRIRVTTEIASVPLNLDKAIPIGLIVTELLSNAAKHAFPDGRGGAIAIEVAREDSGILALRVSDNGVGGEAADKVRGAAANGRVGSMVLTSLVAQLGADMRIEDGEGYCVTVRIPN